MDKLIALVTPASPVLAHALNGAASALALAALGRAVAQDDEATPEQITTALSAGGDVGLKVRHAEADFLKTSGQTAVELARVAQEQRAHSEDSLVHLETVAANDRASARQRQMNTNDQTNKWLAYGVTFGFFVVLIFLMVVAVTGQSITEMPVLYTMLGILGTGWAGVMAFYFGSSVGSKEKNAVLSESATPPKSIGV